MLIKYSILLLCFKILLTRSIPLCARLKKNPLASTDCVAGRRFFARFDQIPKLKQMLPKRILSQLYTFPWTAKIESLYQGSSNICTGILINDRYVITAQKCCLPPLKPEHLTVNLGYGAQTTPSSKCIRCLVKDIILHPGFHDSKPETFHNGIALLKIQPISYSKTIFPIKLPEFTDKYKDIVNLHAEMAGYVSEGDIGFEIVPVKVVNNMQCNNNMFQETNDYETICTSVTEPTTTSCFITPGAPVVWEQPSVLYNVTVLLGVAVGSHSSSKPCRLNEEPMTNVKIAEKLPWIFANTKDAKYCKE